MEDQINVPVPAGVDPDVCWSSANLHNLMTTVRKATTNLDAEWRIHLIVVPATMGCSRGVMYDQIGVPREGCGELLRRRLSGLALRQLRERRGRDAAERAAGVPQSATPRGHPRVQPDPPGEETSADNSIMTTTPSVADVLGGPATGEPGVFPDQINLGFNTTVRNHLAHMPDPVIRPAAGRSPAGSHPARPKPATGSCSTRPSSRSRQPSIPSKPLSAHRSQ